MHFYILRFHEELVRSFSQSTLVWEKDSLFIFFLNLNLSINMHAFGIWV